MAMANMIMTALSGCAVLVALYSSTVKRLQHGCSDCQQAGAAQTADPSFGGQGHFTALQSHRLHACSAAINACFPSKKPFMTRAAAAFGSSTSCVVLCCIGRQGFS